MRTLIDGYNLIFECGLHEKRLDGRSLARSRQRLLKEISAAMTIAQQRETTVVFDARKQMLSGQQEEEYFGELRVLYAIHFREADDMIEHLIRHHAAPKQLTVVSSDHRIHKAAKRRKAQPVDSGPWYDQLQRKADLDNGPQSPDPSAATKPSQDPLLTDQELRALGEDVRRAGWNDQSDDWFEFE